MSAFSPLQRILCVLGLMENPDLEPHNTILKKRFNQAILPIHLAAYHLHPTYLGEKLSTAQKETVHMFMFKNNPKFLNTVLSFEAKSTPFPPSFLTKPLNPNVWWKALPVLISMLDLYRLCLICSKHGIHLHLLNVFSQTLVSYILS